MQLQKFGITLVLLQAPIVGGKIFFTFFVYFIFAAFNHLPLGASFYGFFGVPSLGVFRGRAALHVGRFGHGVL